MAIMNSTSIGKAMRDALEANFALAREELIDEITRDANQKLREGLRKVAVEASLNVEQFVSAIDILDHVQITLRLPKDPTNQP
jgi:hypothetical protein